MIAERLAPISGALVAARTEAAGDAKAALRQAAIDRGLGTLAKVAAAGEKLLAEVEALVALRDADRASGIEWRMVPDLTFPVSKETQNVARAVNRLRGMTL